MLGTQWSLLGCKLIMGIVGVAGAPNQPSEQLAKFPYISPDAAVMGRCPLPDNRVPLRMAVKGTFQ